MGRVSDRYIISTVSHFFNGPFRHGNSASTNYPQASIRTSGITSGLFRSCSSVLKQISRFNRSPMFLKACDTPVGMVKRTPEPSATIRSSISSPSRRRTKTGHTRLLSPSQTGAGDCHEFHLVLSVPRAHCAETRGHQALKARTPRHAGPGGL